MDAMLCMWRSEGNFVASLLSFAFTRDPELNLGSSGPYSNRLYPPSHLTSPIPHLLEAQEAQSP